MGLLSNFAELVNFLVQLSSVMVSVLTSSGNSERNSSRMPSSNTCNLPQTPVSLTRKTSNTPTSNNTFITLTLGHSNDVNHFIFLEHSVQCSKTTGSFHITHNTDNNHGRCLNDCHGLTSLLLVKLGSWLFDFSDNVGHTSLVTQEGS
uniref:Transmembrane protein n=1 Tax=Medicago truncatula TaxID=3880 RepID=I3T0V1_MEDTR|nr:unknown [Medicago truncatula]